MPPLEGSPDEINAMMALVRAWCDYLPISSVTRLSRNNLDPLNHTRLDRKTVLMRHLPERHMTVAVPRTLLERTREYYEHISGSQAALPVEVRSLVFVRDQAPLQLRDVVLSLMWALQQTPDP